MNVFLKITLGIFLALTLFWGKAEASDQKTILFFWAEGCPHCKSEDQFLTELRSKDSSIVIEKYEVSKSKENQRLLNDWGEKLDFDTSGVPITIIGDQYLVGYLKGTTDIKILGFLSDQKASDSEGEVCKIQDPCSTEIDSLNEKLKIPFWGEIETKNFSLAALSVIIGALDGFNPCAMWALVFLISLLLGMKNRKRMWVLGSAFIVTSALVYFIFMSAWLNLLLFIGFISTVRIIIGLVALGGGIYSLKDYLTNKEGACKVGGADKKRAILDKLKSVVHERSFILALLGIIVLAFAVNLVELICSAGLPAVYTQILTMSNLPLWQYYAYILLYIFFFMLDDLIIFFAAMITLQLTGLSTKYTRISRLVGGIIMLLIGLALILKPSWLMFG